MAIDQLIAEQQQETRTIVAALLEDGSEANAKYTIEHHFACTDFGRLEKAAVDIFKSGFEVADAEEVVLDDGAVVFCFDATKTSSLNIDLLDRDCKTLIKLAHKHDVLYDGWGTHFIESDPIQR